MIQIAFNAAEVSAFKDLRKDKDRRIKANIFESKNRWIGTLGEEGLERWLRQNRIPFVRLQRDEQHPYDFEIFGRKMDMKTIGTRCWPLPHYWCDVADEQRDHPTDDYIFGRFNVLTRVLYIFGMMPKPVFWKKAKPLKRGEREGDNKFEAPCPMHHVRIYELKPIEILKERALTR